MEEVYLRRDNAVKIATTETKKAELIAKGYEVIDSPEVDAKGKSNKKDDGKGSNGQPPAN